MVNVHILCVGKLKEKFYLAAVEEYAKRLSRSCRLTLTELPEERLPERPSQAQIDAALEREADAVRARLPKGGVLIALCVEGKSLSSEAFARRISDWMVEGNTTLTFLIGSSFGLHESLKRQAELRLSMSEMTFPHHLARVMLLEQVYRAFQILEGTRYHK
ncbi:MAG: 23S rRNA (pseudouridine(1915)-N(3))-methyltransferase RlmH [Oscillospiraceae bacterium]|nr:23S rRNA (pseudouridine(1915)-N(3))-methyltransferase RlmH [Oscillospiraceae bacterium]